VYYLSLQCVHSSPTNWVFKHSVETAFLFCSYVGSDGLGKEFCIGNSTLESCLDLLAAFLRQDLQLNRLHLFQHGQAIELPVEAFDSKSVSCHLEALRKQWEDILRW